MKKIQKGFIVSFALFLMPILTTHAQALNQDLSIGNSGSQVILLQTWLENNGYLIMPQGTAQGYFGNLTKNALIKYQLSQGIVPSVGYFGPVTRMHMNAVLAYQASTTKPSITLISPNGGENIGVGGTPVNGNSNARIPVIFSQKNFSGFPLYYLIDSSGNISQEKELARAADCSGDCTETAVVIDGHLSNGSTAPSGQYKVKICDPSGTVCDTSANYFTITNII